MGEEKGTFAGMVANTCHENEKFLKERASEVIQEIVKLINDSINYVICWAELWKRNKEKALRSPMFFYINNVLFPFSYAMLVDLLVGNVPACYMELRFMLESLAKCYLAERFGAGKFFEVRLETLEQIFRDKKWTTTKTLSEFGKIVGLHRKPAGLWKRISNRWLHIRGFVTKAIDHLVKTGVPPLYSIVLPQEYSVSDLPILEELGKDVSRFRGILQKTLCELSVI